MNKPRIFATCKAGCQWETVHKDDLYDFTGYSPLEVGANGSLLLPLDSRKYRIYTEQKKITAVAYREEGDLITVYSGNALVSRRTATTCPYMEVGPWYIDKTHTVSNEVKYIVEIDGQTYPVVMSVNDAAQELVAQIYGVSAAYVWAESTTIVAVPHIRYSAYADGSDFTETWSEGQFYMGVAIAEHAPTDKKEYTWSMIGGASADDTISNTLKGSATGGAVRLDDVSPIEHPMKVSVEGGEGIDIGTVKVGVMGKNLLDGNVRSAAVSEGGVTIQYLAEEDVYVLNGTTKKNTACYRRPINVSEKNMKDLSFVGKKLAVSCVVVSGSMDVPSGSTQFFLGSTAGNLCSVFVHNNTSKVSSNVPAGSQIDTWFYSTADGIVFTDYKIKLQIELDDATEHEPYQEPQWFTPNADGIVEDILSNPSAQTWLTDTAGVSVKVEYNRDLNKAFNKLESIVNTLLGG